MMFNSISNRRKVYKQRYQGSESVTYVAYKPWVGTHPFGNRRFDTWREAMEWACAWSFTRNGREYRQPDILIKVVRGEKGVVEPQ